MRKSVTGGADDDPVTGTVRHCYTVASASHRTPSSDGHWRVLLRPGVNNAQMLHLPLPSPGAALSPSVHCITFVASVQLGRDWDGMCWPVKIGMYLGRAALKATVHLLALFRVWRQVHRRKRPPRLGFAAHLVQGLRIHRGAIVHNHRPRACARGLAVSLVYFYKSG